ncbi:MAG: hypothetical protein HRT86_07925 [Ilumatobacteraceae bacterium]|nr:hypothetical protein [Ilumatobacteraceae bacterium]
MPLGTWELLLAPTGRVMSVMKGQTLRGDASISTSATTASPSSKAVPPSVETRDLVNPQRSK